MKKVFEASRHLVEEKAKKFMDEVSDALTTAAKKVLGESVVGDLPEV